MRKEIVNFRIDERLIHGQIAAAWVGSLKIDRLMVIDAMAAKTEIQKLVLKLCEEGMSIVFISSEIEEVVRCSNRIVVMRDRKKVAELKGDDLEHDTILKTIAGGAKTNE